MTTFDKLESVKTLKSYYDETISSQHLKNLLADEERNKGLLVDSDSTNLIMDATHTKLDQHSLQLIQKVADETQIFSKIQSMFKGEKINNTEGRSVLHVALRKPKD